MSDLTQIFGGQAFDHRTVESSQDYDVLPAGDYPVIIQKTNIQQTKAGTGYYIYLELAILEGPGKGRKLFDRLNISNPNSEAVKIAMESLGDLTRSCGVDMCSDTDQLLQKMCMAAVRIKDGRNEVRKYKPLNSAAPAPPVAASAVVLPTASVPPQAYDHRTTVAPAPPVAAATTYPPLSVVTAPPVAAPAAVQSPATVIARPPLSVAAVPPVAAPVAPVLPVAAPAAAVAAPTVLPVAAAVAPAVPPAVAPAAPIGVPPWAQTQAGG